MGSSFSQPEATPEPDPDPPYPPGLHPLRQRRHETQSWAQADYLVKLVLVGHSGAGKSSLMQRAVDHRFDIDLLHWRTDFCCLTIDYKGLKICFQIWDPVSHYFLPRSMKRYFRDAHAILVCFDCDRPDTVSTLEPCLRIISEENLPIDLVSFVGCKVDLHPPLLDDPWAEARKIVVALKPSRDVDCAFAVLPDEIICTIALILLKMDGVTGLPPPYGRAYHGLKRIPRRDLDALSAQYKRPVYLTSAKDGIGVEELILSLAEDIFDTFWIAKDGVPNATTDRAQEVRNTSDDGKDYREQPYCIRRFAKKAYSDI